MSMGIRVWRGTGIVALVLFGSVAAHASVYDLSIGEISMAPSGTPQTALAINGSVPAPTLRFVEGEEITLHVTNTLDSVSSIHWHGLILPSEYDGVPGLSFDGIAPGTRFTYRFQARQHGTYWYHSHSGMQEQRGMYGAIIIDPATPEPFAYDREYVIVLSDWHDSLPEEILRNLKLQSDFYNPRRGTLVEFLDEAQKEGFSEAFSRRKAWGEMRMMSTDIADVSGYTYLLNGMNPEQNWTARFEPHERIRLRFVNAAAMTFFDVRIPGLPMTVVQADGSNVQPVVVDEFRIAVAETYDVIVQPGENRAYTLFAESLSREGYARGTLTASAGLSAEVPPRREALTLTMADMGHAHGSHQGHHQGHHDEHEADAEPTDPFYAVGSGLMPRAAEGGRFLSYADLRAQSPRYPHREADREIEIRLTGNMERYFWSINDLKYSEAQPIKLRLGERVRFRFVNETMMMHPMHLHGMWSILEVGAGQWNPIKHTLSIAPGTTVVADIEADAPGRWAFHCHLLYHMETGMFREVVVESETATIH